MTLRFHRTFTILGLAAAIFAAPAAAQEAQRHFRPEAVRPDPSSPVAQMRAALRGDDAAQAVQIGMAAITANPAPSADDAGEIRWLLADATAAAGDEDASRVHLEALAATPHPLARHARLRLAQSYVDSDPARAAALASTLTDRWAGRWTARMTEARAYIQMNQRDEAIVRLRAILAETPADVTGASAGLPLARLLANGQTVGELEEAIRIHWRIVALAPDTDMARASARSAEELVARLPAARRSAFAQLPIDQAITAARVRARGLRFEEAIAAYDAVLARLPQGPQPSATPGAPAVVDARRCVAGLGRGQAQLRLRRRTAAVPGLTATATACAQHPDETARDAAAWARYEAGRALAALHRPDDSIAQFAALEREHPTHRLADDARVRGALEMRGAGRLAQFRAALANIGETYPEGDMVGRALFQLAWEARARGDHGAALGHLDAAIMRGEVEHLEGMEGQALYWRARTLADLGRADDAKTGYEQVIRAWPLSYYAQHAMVRLDALDHARAEALAATMRHTGPEPGLRFPWRAEFDQRAFRAAISFFRVGDRRHANWELEDLGALGEGADPDMLWVVAALYDRSGDRPAAARLVRERIRSFRRIAPVGRGRALWRLAYPRAFAPLIEQSAARESVPASFVRAIAREESSFNPRAVSWARAYGLVQIIMPTARRFGRQIGVRVNRRTLRDPETNLRIGTHYMRFLFDRYRENPALVPAAYNAGNGAVDRWLTEDGERSLDRFVEEIPYDETRRYTRRVLQTYGVYSWLDEGRLPDMPLGLPSRGAAVAVR